MGADRQFAREHAVLFMGSDLDDDARCRGNRDASRSNFVVERRKLLAGDGGACEGIETPPIIGRINELKVAVAGAKLPISSARGYSFPLRYQPALSRVTIPMTKSVPTIIRD